MDDICGFLVNKWTKPLLGDLNLAKVVKEEEQKKEEKKQRRKK